MTATQSDATGSRAPSSSRPVAARRVSRGRAALERAGRAWRADLILTALAVVTGVSVGLGIVAQPWSEWTTPHLLITAVSRVAAMAGTSLALTGLLLAGRLPWLERSVGQDRLIKWHRVLGPYSLYLIVAHVVLVTIGYSLADRISAWSEFWNLVLTYNWMLPALAGFVALMMIGVTSYRRLRGKLKYETWWTVHLYAYLGIALSFMHQVVDGVMFVSHPTLRHWWTAYYIATFAIIVWFRLLVPIISSLYHGFTVDRIEQENHNTISVIIKGRRLEELKARGGHFFGFRFIARRYWWESHPYSISASPRNDRLRITVKDLGDHSGWLRSVKPGTRVWIEGPYGVFHADNVHSDAVTLIGAGIGITPLRAILEELPLGTDVDLVWRASKEEDLVLRHEVEELAAWHGARLHYVVGSRTMADLDAATLRQLVPHIRETDVFLCGPEEVIHRAARACHALGVPEHRIHEEAFTY